MADGTSSTTAALATTEKQNAGTLMRQATDVAGVCGEIVKRTAQNIQGRKYVKVEGWQSIAAAYGCLASSRNVEKVPGGFKAVGEVRRMSDGVLLAEAEGFVGEDEPVWFGGGFNKKTGQPYERRPEYAVRAMAQTRAISRACRSAFAFVVTMIDGSLSTTPAEEMDGLDIPAAERTVNAPASRLSPGTPRPAPKPDNGAVFPNYGRAKGAPVAGASKQDLDFYANGCRRSLADPAKKNFHAKEAVLLAAIEAEQRRQSGAQSSHGDDRQSDGSRPGEDDQNEPPPHTDDDRQF